MTTLQVGDAVDIVLDGIGVRQGTVMAMPHGQDVVYVKVRCAGGNPCDFGYRHPFGLMPSHISRVKREKVNPSKMPKLIRTYEDLWGNDDD